jgi:hypothetical protein
MKVVELKFHSRKSVLMFFALCASPRARCSHSRRRRCRTPHGSQAATLAFLGILIARRCISAVSRALCRFCTPVINVLLDFACTKEARESAALYCFDGTSLIYAVDFQNTKSFNPLFVLLQFLCDLFPATKMLDNGID